MRFGVDQNNRKKWNLDSPGLVHVCSDAAKAIKARDFDVKDFLCVSINLNLTIPFPASRMSTLTLGSCSVRRAASTHPEMPPIHRSSSALVRKDSATSKKKLAGFFFFFTDFQQ